MPIFQGGGPYNIESSEGLGMHPDQYLLKEMKVWSFENILILIVEKEFTIKQAGAELCQAQGSLSLLPTSCGFV